MRVFFKSPNSLASSLFRTFLKQNCAYDSFMRNLSKFSSASNFRNSSRFDPEDYVAVAFPWVSTPEGSAYWSKLDRKWCSAVRIFKL